MATYLKIDLTKPQHIELLLQLKAHFLSERKDNILSVNRNITDTMAWVKTITMPVMAPGMSDIVLDTATWGIDHDKVIQEVNTVEWGGEDVTE